MMMMMNHNPTDIIRKFAISISMVPGSMIGENVRDESSRGGMSGSRDRISGTRNRSGTHIVSAIVQGR